MFNLTNDFLKKSWERSRVHGANQVKAKDAILTEYEFKQYLEPNEALLRDIYPTIEHLAHWLKFSGSVVVLSDIHGFLLETVGDPKLLKSTEKINLLNGACWSEEVRGTNSAGTVIVEQKPLAVVGKEHYLQSDQILYCIGSPIFNPTGELIAVLNIGGYFETYQPSMIGMLDIISRNIEDWMLIHQTNPQLIISMHQEQQVNYQALLAVNEHGFITSANREARNLLNMKTITPDQIHIEQVLNGTNCLLKGSKGLSQSRSVDLLSKNSDQNQFFASILVDSRQQLFLPSGGKSMKSLEKPKKAKRNSDTTYTFDDIYGNDLAFQKVLHTAKRAASTNYTILITGESGTGKDMVSQAIHNTSSRSDKPFIAFNCGAITKSLMESELFGYESGAFTGAKQSGQPGKFELADGGTLFLDEIAEMPSEMQVALLRVMQDFTFTRIGGEKPIKVDVRIIAATHTNLWEKVQDGSFREDLFYRLQGIHITIPPLRERTDRLQIAELLLKKVEAELGGDRFTFSLATKQLIESYSWPGNVRQSLGAIREAAFRSEGVLIEVENFPSYILSDYKQDKVGKQSLADTENREILKVLKKTGGNITQSAKLLGIGRTTLYRKLKVINNFTNSDKQST